MTEYKFNDYPFNAMSFIRDNLIEACFNIGNPKKGDIITKGQVRYKITKAEYQTQNLTLLKVKKEKSL